MLQFESTAETYATTNSADHRAARYPKKSRGHPLRTVAERYARIKTMSDEYPIKSLCLVMEVSRSGYYRWSNAGELPRAQQTKRLNLLIKQTHAKSRQTYGSPRITAALRAGGETVGRSRNHSRIPPPCLRLHRKAAQEPEWPHEIIHT